MPSHREGPHTAASTLAGWLRSASYVAALTGAGISTESGIPDFRGPQGVWTKNPAAEKTATLQHYLADPEIRRLAWRNRLRSEIWSATPNAGHRALVEIERAGFLHSLVTQNIDGLHLVAGHDPGIVVEIHGNVREVKCMGCAWRGPMAEALARVEAGEDDPPCERCGGILKSATISFGEDLVPADLATAQHAAAAADVFLALGTSLTVYPAAALPEVALRDGARLAVCNAEPTPFDPVADLVVRAPLGEVLPAVAAALAGAGTSAPPSPLGKPDRHGRI